MAGITQVADSEIFKGVRVSDKLFLVLIIHALLGINERPPLARECKSCEEIRLNGVAEESILGLPAVMVHAVPKDCEIEVLLLLQLN